MTTLGHDAAATRHPDWMVQTVFDPYGGGHDFAYTIGLHDRGLPELHMWARPSLGDDPAEDWMLSPADRCILLNEVAWRLIDGDLQVGAHWAQSYDEGLTEARFRVDPPADRDELEAFGIAPGAIVLPVRWSLHRAPIGRAAPLSPRARRRAEFDYRAIVETLDPPVGLPRGWRLPTRLPRFDATGRFGPLTALVTARAAQLTQMSAEDLFVLTEVAAVVDDRQSLTYPVAVAAAVARSTGRVSQVRRLQSECERLIDALLARPAWRARWTSVEREWSSDVDDAETCRRLPGNLKHLLTSVTISLLTSEAVADALTREQLAAARGPWLYATGPAGEIPGIEWRAPDDVLAEVFDLLSPLDGAGLWQVGDLHTSGDGPDGPVGQEYDELALRLLGSALTSAVGCPWAGCLDRLPAICHAGARQARRLGYRMLDDADVVVAPIPELQRAATVLTSALCRASALSDREADVVTRRFAGVLPGLGDAIGRRRTRVP